MRTKSLPTINFGLVSAEFSYLSDNWDSYLSRVNLCKSPPN